MTTVFADTVFYLALLNPRDQYALASEEFSSVFDGRFVTTSEVLTEVANAFSATPQRTLVSDLWKSIDNDPETELIFADRTLWLQSLELYSERPEKGWSLTDCMSFLVMQDRGISEALTADHHFEQAGFTILLK
jgi:predicted nucleic acid-binding protein